MQKTIYQQEIASRYVVIPIIQHDLPLSGFSSSHFTPRGQLMKTEITVSRIALIGTIVMTIAGIVVALITHFAPSKPDKPLLQPPPSAAQSLPQPVIQGNQGEVTIINGNGNIKAGGNVTTHTTSR